MKASSNVGLGSEKAHYTKLLKDYELGLLPPDIDIELIRAKVKEYEPFEPPAIMSQVWTGFWQIRNTKAFETPINHTDVYYFTRVMGIEYEQWEVRGLFALDRAWYAAYDKYNK